MPSISSYECSYTLMLIQSGTIIELLIRIFCFNVKYILWSIKLNLIVGNELYERSDSVLNSLAELRTIYVLD